jgi:hypothetical protein
VKNGEIQGRFGEKKAGICIQGISVVQKFQQSQFVHQLQGKITVSSRLFVCSRDGHPLRT